VRIVRVAKYSPRVTAGELQEIVESRGQHIVVRYCLNFNRDRLLWSNETKKTKKLLYGSKPTRRNQG